MIRSAMALALAAMALAPASVAAQKAEEVEVEQVKDRKSVTLDPGKAYLMIEAPGMMISSWISMPSAAQRADWQAQRSEELAEAIVDYPKDLARYERRHASWSKEEVGREPERPVEPTEESFPWPDLESRRVFSVGPQNRFASEKDYSLWLMAVPEGEYLFYGFGNQTFSDCACMGSLAFEVKTGKITALRISNAWLDGAGQRIDGFPKGMNSLDVQTRFGMVVEPPSDFSLDPRLPREMITVPEFRLVERLPNWFGGTVNRVLPFPGLFTYDGTKMVDLRAAE